jgi:nucleotide-binding universal stress UspA family protein
MPIIDVKCILCPIDFSPCSELALEHAINLAHWYDARVTVLHVFEFFVMPQVLPVSPGPMIVPYPSHEQLVADVERFVEPLRNPRVPLDITVQHGNVARTIVETAGGLASDMIVIGTHGRGGVEHLMLGSVAEKVLRKAPCPVFIVPSALGAHQPTGRLRHILCPVDFGPTSMRAVEHALSLAQEANAALTLLHVIEAVPDEAMATAFVDVVEYRRRRDADARARLRAATPAGARMWCHVSEIVAEGKPYREILRASREMGVDLIVMGVAGRNAVDLMFGSTTNHVVRQAGCPVLTLRTTSAQKFMEKEEKEGDHHDYPTGQEREGTRKEGGSPHTV